MISNLIVLITGLIGIITAGLILKNHKLNSVMNIYIILIIIAISIRFTLLGLTNFTADESLKSFYSRYSNVALIIIPLFYLYFKKLFKGDIRLEKKELVHFIFPVSFFIFLINLDFFKINQKYTAYTLSALFFTYVFYYTFQSFRTLNKNIQQKKGVMKINQKQSVLTTKWTYFLFLAILCLAIRLIVSIFFELNLGRSIRGYSFQWISALIWLLVMFKILVSPEILYGYDVLHKKIDEKRNENLILNSIWDVNPKIQIKNAQHLLLKEKIEPNILSYIEKLTGGTSMAHQDP
jgi:hypothetical protein